MTFRVGQKVVCVGCEGTPGTDWSAWMKRWKIMRPERGPVYTIRDIRVGPRGQMLRLIEIVNPVAEFSDAPHQEPWWWAGAFRPVVERQTDISVFTEMLHTTKAPIRAALQEAGRS